MATKQIQEQYRVDAKFFEAAPLKRYQDTLPDDVKRSKQVKFVGLCLLPGTRSYECKVVGTRDKVKLSGSDSLRAFRYAKKRTSKLNYLPKN
jgi:hypothetical protein